MNFDVIKKESNWQCFQCEKLYPNTLRYCPTCNIAKKHSDNLRITFDNKKKR